MTQTLTGRRRYRADADGRIVLQVEVRLSFPAPTTPIGWRDACLEDLSVHTDDAAPVIETRTAAVA